MRNISELIFVCQRIKNNKCCYFPTKQLFSKLAQITNRTICFKYFYFAFKTIGGLCMKKVMLHLNHRQYLLFNVCALNGKYSSLK